MAAAVTGLTWLQSFFNGRSFLRETRQRVVLAEYAYDGTALAVSSSESRRHSCDAALNFEPLTLGIIGKQPRRPSLAQRGLGERPHLIAEIRKLGSMFLY